MAWCKLSVKKARWIPLIGECGGKYQLVLVVVEEINELYPLDTYFEDPKPYSTKSKNPHVILVASWAPGVHWLVVNRVVQ